MKTKLILIFLLSFYLGISQGWEWKRNIYSLSTLKDALNNVYAFSKPGIKGFTITKLDANGQTLWSLTCANGIFTSAKLDKDTNLVILGNLTVPATLDTLHFTPAGQRSFFLAKLSPSGKGLHGNVFGDSGFISAKDLFISKNGDYLICGQFNRQFSINGYLITSADTVNVGFLLRMKNNNVLWHEVADFWSGGDYSTLDEIVETESGKYYATVTMIGGVVEFHGYKFQYSGQSLMQLDSSRQVKWITGLGYPGLTFDYWQDIKVAGDTVFMKQYFEQHNVSSAVYEWLPNGGLAASYGFPAYGLGYDVANGKIYYAYGYEVVNLPPHNFFHIGVISQSTFHTLHEDSIAYTGSSYIHDLAFVSDGQYYICGNEESAFIGKFNAGLAIGIPEIEGPPRVQVYPNPVSTDINIHLTGNSSSNITIQNQLGETLLCTQADREKEKRIDLSNFSNGIYFIHIQIGEKQEIRKIIIE